MGSPAWQGEPFLNLKHAMPPKIRLGALVKFLGIDDLLRVRIDCCGTSCLALRQLSHALRRRSLVERLPKLLQQHSPASIFDPNSRPMEHEPVATAVS